MRAGTATTEIPFGTVPAGWCVASWSARLAYLAEACKPLHPELSAWYQEWVRRIKTEPRAAAPAHRPAIPPSISGNGPTPKGA